MRLLAAALAQDVAAADMDRRPAAQVGQTEVDAPVAAEGGAEQREQRLVLVDREQLSVGQRPPLGRKHKRHHPDFREQRLGHVPPFVSPAKIRSGNTKRNYTTKST